MRYFPNPDISVYVEGTSPWQRCIHYGRSYSWKLHDNTKSNVMYYWRDLEGSKKDVIKKDDLYIKGLHKSRIRKEACLPLLYATGYRFIRVTKAPPANFKCAPLPVNLATARIVKVELKKKKKAAKKAAKKARAEAKKAQKEAKKLAKLQAEKEQKKLDKL